MSKESGNGERNNSDTHSSPELLVPPQTPKQNSSQKSGEATDSVSVDLLINEAKFARCRNRVVIPVILYQGKYICR